MAVLALAALGFSPLFGIEINGIGATFPAPLYQRWFQEYNARHPDVRVNYEPIGSAAGIKQFTKETMDFGASDAAMTDEQIARVRNGVLLLPMTAGEIVLAYNLPGVPTLKLTRAAYTGIFLGSIRRWNDVAITNHNPGVKLPDLPITVVYRYDGSGTTYVFTKHLCAVSPEFRQCVVGEGTQVTWPVGLGGRGNEGVASLVHQKAGAIGYVEYGYAEENKLPMAALQNKTGNFISPALANGAATLARVDLAADLRGFSDDPTGPDDYPITTFTWILAHKTYPDAAKAAALRSVLLYGVTEGQKYATELGYIPLPADVAERVKGAVTTISGGP